MPRLFPLFILSLLIAAPVLATPAEIIFLRHGEKPAEGPELNARGNERARALVALFETDARVLSHGKPAAIFSAKPSKAGGSVRSIETMVPTSKALGIPVDSRFTKDDLPALVQAVLSDPTLDGRTVVVCWEHKKIPGIVRAFGWMKAPEHWDDSVFDRLWILDFEAGKPIRFRDLPEQLLSGDSSN